MNTGYNSARETIRVGGLRGNMARERAGATGGFIYGEKENGGTSTFYV